MVQRASGTSTAAFMTPIPCETAIEMSGETALVVDRDVDAHACDAAMCADLDRVEDTTFFRLALYRKGKETTLSLLEV